MRRRPVVFALIVKRSDSAERYALLAVPKKIWYCFVPNVQNLPASRLHALILTLLGRKLLHSILISVICVENQVECSAWMFIEIMYAISISVRFATKIYQTSIHLCLLREMGTCWLIFFQKGNINPIKTSMVFCNIIIIFHNNSLFYRITMTLMKIRIRFKINSYSSSKIQF